MGQTGIVLVGIMLRLILLGMVAAALFSSTFVLNEMMSQAGEVLFALFAGMLFLNHGWPNFTAMLGLALIIVGLLLFVRVK